jgi:hypothetical protein
VQAIRQHLRRHRCPLLAERYAIGKIRLKQNRQEGGFLFLSHKIKASKKQKAEGYAGLITFIICAINFNSNEGP